MNEVVARLLQSPPEALEALHKNMSVLKHQLRVFAITLEATTPQMAPETAAELPPSAPVRHNTSIATEEAEIHSLLCNAAQQFSKVRCQFRELRDMSLPGYLRMLAWRIYIH